MYNKVILLGRITQDLEPKTTAGGVPVLTFSVAADRRYQEKGGERKSDFFNCVAWRSEADFIARFWSKGEPILIEGELQNRSYTDKNGQTRQITEIVVDRAAFTGDGGQKSAPPLPPEPPNVQRVQQSNQTSSPVSGNDNVSVDDTDEDYPF